MKAVLLVIVLALLAAQDALAFRASSSSRERRACTSTRQPLYTRGLQARKLDAEADAMNKNKGGAKASNNKKGKGGKGKRQAGGTKASKKLEAEAPVVELKVDSAVVTKDEKASASTPAPTLASTAVATEMDTIDVVRQSVEADEPQELWVQPDSGTTSSPPIMSIPPPPLFEEEGEEGGGFEMVSSEDVLRAPPSLYVYGSNKGGENAPPPAEVVFFGEPRRPPPIEALRDTRYHGPLLSWARHANVIPRSTEERAVKVYPRPPSSSSSSSSSSFSSLFLGDSPAAVTYSDIFDGFAKVMGSVEQSKAYIQANVAMVPPKLFLRALTAEKLSAQSKNDIQRMDYLKEVRSAYILAHDQLYFPLNIELQKAETRVMTYVGRTEMFEALQTWDAVEMSSFFTTLLAARLTWDGRVKSVLGQIDNKIKDTVEYMADGIRSDLMTRTFKKPGQSAEIYMNATIAIQARAQERYQAMIPEVRAVQETFFMLAEGDFLQARAYVLENFLPRNGLDRTEFMIGLRAYEAALGAMQGIDYIELRLMVNKLHEILCDKGELQARDKWYGDFREKDPRAQFETYETDEIPMMIKSDQRMRDTGNAFENFVVQVLKGKTKYSNALSGSRAKGAAVGNWLERDPDWNLRQPSSIEERVENFKEAYMKQTESRKLEESIKLFKADDE